MKLQNLPENVVCTFCCVRGGSNKMHSWYPECGPGVMLKQNEAKCGQELGSRAEAQHKQPECQATIF